MESQDPFGEKRLYPRYPADFLDIQGRILFSSNITILNISVGGIAFGIDKHLKEGRTYALRLERHGKIINLTGTIMWSARCPGAQKTGDIPQLYTAGMKFSNLLNSQISELEGFIKDNFKDYQKLESGGRGLSGIRLHVRIHIHEPEKATVNYIEYYKVRKISQSGMLIESNCALDIEDSVPMTMTLSESKALAFWGRIVTSHEIEGPGGQRYQIGIEFTDMSVSDRALLQEFIASLTDSP